MVSVMKPCTSACNSKVMLYRVQVLICDWHKPVGTPPKPTLEQER